MALEQKLSLKLSQKLVMTPSLQQAIKLLQMTRMELQNLLTQEIVENPLLEEVEEGVEEERPSEQEASAEEGAEDELDHEESMNDIDLEAYFNDYWESGTEPRGVEPREAPPIENSLTREPDLYDHLLWQLHMSDTPSRQVEIAELIIGNLNPDGFLVATVDEIRAMIEDPADAPATCDEIEAALRQVRSFDPPGVGWTDLRSSLLAQLERQGKDPASLAWRVIDECWDLFLKRQFAAIAKHLDVPLAELEPVVETIRNLETRPGRGFSSDRPSYIEPDVAVIRVGNDYVIQLNDDGMPRLRISRAYRRMLQKLRRDGRQSEARQFLKDKMRSAMWLIKSLDQRQRTIYKVANSIVRQQRAFLDHGIDRLRPMVLRDVADDIGMHESTVSRVVSNKYMHTPRGVFPMKFFFHSGIDRDYGEDISSLTVKRKIQQLIEAEDSHKPLSDSSLMKRLNREGINIARRTVAKYRDELGIPSSTQRKQIF
ncbi:MAG TPA: RNA polymerase factor sigma-54 [Thermoanaerobaculia bacterium]|nr:RNA polymerase factor sigma-54 [Thermoanaerobaculia bacterium]